MKHLLPALFIAAFLSVSLTSAAQAGKPEFAKKNQPSYWGKDCYKLEIDGDVNTYTVTDPDAVIVIVKGGTHHKVYTEGPFTDLTAAYNKRSKKTYGISHVTICTDKQEKPEPEAPEEETPQEQDNGEVAGDTDKPTPTQKQPAGKGEVLAETGAPAVVNAVLGTTLSAVAGATSLASKKRKAQTRRIKEIAL